MISKCTCIFFYRVFEVLDMMKSVDAAQENVLKALLTYIYSLCVGFGKYITQSRVNVKYHFIELHRNIIKIFNNSDDSDLLNFELFLNFLILFIDSSN